MKFTTLLPMSVAALLIVESVDADNRSERNAITPSSSTMLTPPATAIIRSPTNHDAQNVSNPNSGVPVGSARVIARLRLTNSPAAVPAEAREEALEQIRSVAPTLSSDILVEDALNFAIELNGDELPMVLQLDTVTVIETLSPSVLAPISTGTSRTR